MNKKVVIFMNNKTKKKLNQSGNPNYYLVTDNKNESIVSFKYIEKYPDGSEQENFNPLNVIDFVAKSYQNSCLSLIEKINKGLTKDRRSLISLLPLLFCFRHYIELKLKLLYADNKNEEFSTCHDLIKLKENLERDCNYNADIFDEPINYIANLENGHNEHFRFLVTKDFTFTDKIIIPTNIGEKIFNYIHRIETSTTQSRINRLSTN